MTIIVGQFAQRLPFANPAELHQQQKASTLSFQVRRVPQSVSCTVYFSRSPHHPPRLSYFFDIPKYSPPNHNQNHAKVTTNSFYFLL